MADGSHISGTGAFSCRKVLIMVRGGEKAGREELGEGCEEAVQGILQLPSSL